MKDELKELQQELRNVLDGSYSGNIETIWNSIFFCAAKRDGYFGELLDILGDFLSDFRVCQIKELAGLFINMNVELDCFKDEDINPLVKKMTEHFHNVGENTKFSICELWGSIGTQVVLDEINKIVPSDNQERNFLAHALGHIMKKSRNQDIVESAGKMLNRLGGNPDTW